MVVAFDQGATDVCIKNGVVTMPADEQMETSCVRLILKALLPFDKSVL